MNRAALVAVAVFVAAPALAMEKGDACVLQAPLPVVVHRAGGTVETVLDVGSTVEVLVVGDEGRTRISTGDTPASVATRDLEAACAGTLQICRASAEMTLFERNRSDSKSWRIKPGAPVSVLRTGKTWAHLRVGDLEGFARADEVKQRCPLTRGGTVNDTADASLPTEEVERGEGPGVLLLPLLLEGAAPAGSADMLSEVFYDRLAYYRPDAGRLPLEEGASRAAATGPAWKKHVETSALRARAAGLAYVIVGKLSMESDKDGKGVLVVSLAAVDAATGRTLKGVRARPTLRPEDPWAENVLAALLPLLAAAPGARLPAPAGPQKTEAPPPTTTNTATTTTKTAAVHDDTPAWFANPWGYVALGTSMLAVAGAGIAGALAQADNSAANETPPVDEARGALREAALQKAIVADSLTGVAVVAGLATIYVFAARAGLE